MGFVFRRVRNENLGHGECQAPYGPYSYILLTSGLLFTVYPLENMIWHL
jgi:hypothetical protein